MTASPALESRILSALADPQAEVVCVGPRARWARPMLQTIWNLAVYGTLGAGVFTAGMSLAEVSGVGPEIAARANPMEVLAQHPQRVQWLQMPTTPFLEVARTDEGGYSINRLIGAYKAAGMNQAQAQQVALRLRDFSPVLMGARDDELARQLQHQALATAARLQRDYPVFHRRLSLMVENNEVHISYRHARWDHVDNWPQVRSQTWAAEGVMNTGTLEKDELVGVDFAHAKEMAELAVEETGVRALRVHPANWSAEGLFELSRGLLDAEVDLKEATGLEGQVLGLGGRVVLMMGSPPVREQAAGITKVAQSGAVFVNAEWSNLSHEWFHALDFVAAQNVLSAPAVNSLSEQTHPLRLTENRTVFHAWRQAIENIKITSPRWQQARENRVHEEAQAREALAENKTVQRGAITSPDYDQAYWVSPTEGLAYAFQAFVSDADPLVLKGRTNVQEDFRMPSPDEVEQQSHVWKALFAHVKSLGLTVPMPKPLPVAAMSRAPGVG